MKFNVRIMRANLIALLVGQLFNIAAAQTCSCGRSVSNRIIDGEETTRGEYPWMAVIISKKNPTYSQCGASLITSRYAVTAYHCVSDKKPSSYSLLLGAYSLSNQDYDSVIIDIVDFIKYQPRHHDVDDDIALIELESDVEFGTYIQPICLALSNTNYAGVEAVVMGYGATGTKDNGDGKDYSDVPLQGEVYVTSTEDCNEVMAWHESTVYDNQLCAGAYNGQPDHCFGDSGGPLMYYDENVGSWRLIGVVSSSYECGDDEDYSFYTNVSYFGDWIRENSDYQDC